MNESETKTLTHGSDESGSVELEPVKKVPWWKPDPSIPPEFAEDFRSAQGFGFGSLIGFALANQKFSRLQRVLIIGGIIFLVFGLTIVLVDGGWLP